MSRFIPSRGNLQQVSPRSDGVRMYSRPKRWKDLIEHSRPSRHLLRVRSVKAMLALLLALAWVPLTSHCLLESACGFEFLRCAADTQGSPANPDHCGDNGCCSVEEASYQTPSHQETVCVFALTLLSSELSADSECSFRPQVTLGPLTSAPPELSTAWQFSSRTALPSRAPSLVS
jgi:hypothetical protein